jgi:uncharacterized protein YndB with AHSA1/START domain
MSAKKKVSKTKSLPKSKTKTLMKKDKKAKSKKNEPKKAIDKTKIKIKPTPKKKLEPKKAINKTIAKPKVVAKSPIKSKPNKITKFANTKVSKKLIVNNKGKKEIKAKSQATAKQTIPQKVQKPIKIKIPIKTKEAEKIKVKVEKAPKVPKPIPAEKLRKLEEASIKKQLIEQKSKEVLAINNNIPVLAKNDISLSKIASISQSITNPVKRSDSYSIKPDKEPIGKFELEFVVHASADMIYEFISTPSGLSEWFCDDLNIRNGIYTFIWEDAMQQARLLKTVDLQLVRFQWVDKTDGSYFELRIQRDDLTNDISLMITDFAESAVERESSRLLWHNQIEKLMHVLGSVF